MVEKSTEGEERKKLRVITILQLPGSSLLCHISFNCSANHIRGYQSPEHRSTRHPRHASAIHSSSHAYTRCGCCHSSWVR